MNELFMGDRNKTAMFYESGTYGSTSGTAQWIGMVTSNEISESENINSTRYQGTDTRNVDKHVEGARDVTGTLTYHPQDWRMLQFALGYNVDGGSPSPYTHTITELENCSGNYYTSDGPFPSFTVSDEKCGGVTGSNFIREVNGCIVNNMTITGDQGGMIECSIDYVGKSTVPKSGALTTLTEPSYRPFLWNDVAIDIPSGTRMDKTKSFEISIGNNLDPKHYMNGSRDIKYPVPQGRDYSLNLTMDMDKAQAMILYRDYYKSGVEFNAVANINVSTGSRELPLIMSGCRITEMPIPSPMEGVNEYEVTIVPKSMSGIATDSVEKYSAW